MRRRAHAEDRAGCASPPPSVTQACDGSSFTSWASPYFDPTASAWGLLDFEQLTDPMQMVDGWICGGIVYTGSGALDQCVVSSGWADTLVDSSYVQGASGYATGSAGPFADVLLESGTPAAYDSPVVSASHVIAGGVPEFFVDYDDTTAGAAAPQEIAVVLDGTALTASLDTGTAAQGTYTVSAPDTSTGCRSYVVIAVTGAGKLWQYPASGTFETYGEGSCTSDYAP